MSVAMANNSAGPNPSAPFAQRAIDLTFILGGGATFTNSNTDTLKVTGLKVQASIIIPGEQALGAAQIAVYGLPLQAMNDLSTLGDAFFNARNNSVIVESGDIGGSMSIVFQGTIAQAWADFEGAPDVSFQLMAVPGYYAKIAASSATSYSGPVNVTVVLADLAKRAGLAFQPNNVSVLLSNPYFPGTVTDQIIACCEAAQVNFSMERGTLSIWTRTTTSGDSGLVLSSMEDMVGYPTFLPQGISVTTLHNPLLQNGQTFQIQSILKPACGTWQAVQLVHNLESQTPDGQWFTSIMAVKSGQVFVPQ